MAYLVLGLASAKPVTIDDAAASDKFPGFLELMTGLGADIAPSEIDGGGRDRGRWPSGGGKAPAPACANSAMPI